MQDIPDHSIDMILCDPPYEITARNPWDKRLPFDKMWQQYYRVAKETAPILLFCAGRYTAELIVSNILDFKYKWIWCKNLKSGNLNARSRPMSGYEEICVFYENQPIYKPQKILRTYQQKSGNTKNSMSTNYGSQKEDYTDRQNEWLMPDDVLYFDCVHNSTGKLHPTQKPVELLEYLIRTYTNESDTVLDSCMGSGSTGVAAVNTNRNFIGIELQEDYYNIAKDRIEQAQKYPGTEYKKPVQGTNMKLF